MLQKSLWKTALFWSYHNISGFLLRVPALLRWNAGVLHDPAHHKIRLLQMGIEKTKRRLSHFEELFKIETLLFYQAFQTGDMGDKMEYMKWAGEYETLLQLEEEK